MPDRPDANSPAGHQKTILVLDDEPDVRKLIATMLSKNGYTVLSAANGESAINSFQRSKQPVDLALLDVVSPGLSGPMVAEQLKQLRPGLRVLFMSGYTDTAVVQRYVIEKGHTMLTKPFTAKQLTKKIREVLSAETEK